MIMTRKNLILLLFSLLTLNSCNKHEGPELRFCENYIQNYCQGDLVLPVSYTHLTLPTT